MSRKRKCEAESHQFMPFGVTTCNRNAGHAGYHAFGDLWWPRELPEPRPDHVEFVAACFTAMRESLVPADQRAMADYDAAWKAALVEMGDVSPLP